MANLVISDQSFTASVGQRVTFQSRNDPINGIINFSETDSFLAATGCEDCCLIEEVGQIGTRETRCSACNALE